MSQFNISYYYLYFSPTPLLPSDPTQESVEKFLRNGITYLRGLWFVALS